MRLHAAILVNVGALGLATVAHADTVYTSAAAFDAAISGTTTIDFNGIAATDSYVNYGARPLTVSGVSFTSNSYLIAIDPGDIGRSYAGGGFLSSFYSTPDIVTAVVPSTTAIGFNIGGLYGPVAYRVKLSDGFSYSSTSNTSILGTDTLDFVGFTSHRPLTSVKIYTTDSPYYNAIDNFTFRGTSAAVPEPATWTLMLVGLGIIGSVARRRQNVRVTYG